MRVNGILSCSLVNGYGIRYVIFVQGCKHHCPGCQNPDTWDFNGGIEMSVEDIIADIKRHKYIDGITLSGGDPFYQQDECVKLIRALPDDLTVWIYTGFTYEEIMNTELASLADYIVDGPFRQEELIEGQMYGSANQRIIKVKR